MNNQVRNQLAKYKQRLEKTQRVKNSIIDMFTTSTKEKSMYEMLMADPETRKKVKTCLLGIDYGMTEETVMAHMEKEINHEVLTIVLENAKKFLMRANKKTRSEETY